MDFLRSGVLFSLCSLVLSLFLALVINMLHKSWWVPMQVQRKMAVQGIKGPAYRFFHGSTKEMLQMKREATSRPMSLSHDIFPYVQPHFHNWARTYGRNFLGWHGPQAFVFISDLDMVKQSMVPALVDSAHMIIQRWSYRECQEINVYEEFKLCTSDAISKTAFGSSYIEGKSVFENLVKLGLIVAKASSQIRLPGVSKLWKPTYELEAEKLEKGLREAVIKIINRRQQKMNCGETENYKDFLGLLLKATHDADENKKITFDNVITECKTFYSAAQETTSSLLSWTVFPLAIHTDWQQEARKEVLDVLGNRDPNFDGVKKLRKMGTIINESLRLYPPAVGVHRKVTRQAKLGKLVLPSGTMVYIPILNIHHDPQVWGDDAHLFKPERFSEGVAKGANGENFVIFLPFGLGPRSCVGENFATVEAKIVLAMILQRYTFTLSPAYVHSPVDIHFSRPQYGVQVILNST